MPLSWSIILTWAGHKRMDGMIWPGSGFNLTRVKQLYFFSFSLQLLQDELIFYFVKNSPVLQILDVWQFLHLLLPHAIVVLLVPFIVWILGAVSVHSTFSRLDCLQQCNIYFSFTFNKDCNPQIFICLSPLYLSIDW